MEVARPPGPRDGLFGLRLIAQVKRGTLGFYIDVHRRYGDVVYMRLAYFQDYCFFHPAQVREILIEKAKSFVRMPLPINVLRCQSSLRR